jgi:tetratricopeptide (TPR) repeat protein
MGARRALAATVLSLLGAGLVSGCRAQDQPDGPARRADPRVHAFWQTYRRASHSRSEGRLEEALRDYDQALALRPGHQDALYYRGNCALELGRYTEAVASYEELLRVDPTGSSRGYMQLGLVHAAMDEKAPRDLARAEEYLQQALALDPDSGAVLALGELALLRGRTADAERLLSDASAGDPMSVAAPYLLGYLAWEAGRPARAWELFRLAVSRGELKKAAVKWTEEGDVKADPALRWRALARQSLTGGHWIRLRGYLREPGPSREDMVREYERLKRALRAARDVS